MKSDGHTETSLISYITGFLFILVGLILIYTQYDIADYGAIVIGVLFLLFGITESKKII